MWRETSILLMFAVGMTLLYLGLERLLPALAAPLLNGRRRDGSGEARAGSGLLLRVALLGLALALLGALTVYYAVLRLR